MALSVLSAGKTTTRPDSRIQFGELHLFIGKNFIVVIAHVRNLTWCAHGEPWGANTTASNRMRARP